MKKAITPEIAPKLLLSRRKLLLLLKVRKNVSHALEHLALRSLRPATHVDKRDISNVIAPKRLLVTPLVNLRAQVPPNVEERLNVLLVRRNHLVHATTVDRKVILRANAKTRPSNSPKDPELVVVPVEAATEDALRPVTDVDLKTTWFAIVLSPT